MLCLIIHTFRVLGAIAGIREKFTSSSSENLSDPVFIFSIITKLCNIGYSTTTLYKFYFKRSAYIQIANSGLSDESLLEKPSRLVLKIELT